jgi:uncharacterized RmlC-like cupin family protein
MGVRNWRNDGVKVVRAAAQQLALASGQGRATAFDFAGTGGPNIWMGTVTLKPNGQTGAHHHGTHEVAVYVSNGRSRIRWGERLEFTTDVGPGDFVYFAPQVPHQEINLDPEEPVDFVVVRSDNTGTRIDGEISQLLQIFSEAKRNAFWVVEAGDKIIGMFGIESRNNESTELRRMYLDRRYRGRGIAQRMLLCAETRARELGFVNLVLSTSEVQKAAITFYRKSSYALVRSEHADTMSTRTVGGGLTRFHFEKTL